MSYYLRRGDVPHKRHTQFRRPDGSLYHEEVMGIHGFAAFEDETCAGIWSPARREGRGEEGGRP